MNHEHIYYIRKTKSYGSIPTSPSTHDITCTPIQSDSHIPHVGTLFISDQYNRPSSTELHRLERGEITYSPFEIDMSDNIQINHISPSNNYTPIKYMYTCFQYTKNTCCLFIICVPTKIVRFIQIHKIEALNYFISIFLHVFLMIIFEIYFYFNYVVVIEKEVFLAKINSYFQDLGRYNHAKYSPQLVALLLQDTKYDDLLAQSYQKYIISLTKQKDLLALLLHRSIQIATIFGIILLSLIGLGILHLKKIKWRWILAENVIMLGLLGCFEYLFFTTIILQYNPITDAELEYLVIKNIDNYITSNSSEYNNTYTNTFAPTIGW